jgi:SpoVK/Ycf46/Vps4 family AAA+-type ATPase
MVISAASEILNPIDLKVSWKDIGGLDDIIDELQELVVLPFTRPDIFSSKSQLLKPPRGELVRRALSFQHACIYR